MVVGGLYLRYSKDNWINFFWFVFIEYCSPLSYPAAFVDNVVLTVEYV